MFDHFVSLELKGFRYHELREFSAFQSYDIFAVISAKQVKEQVNSFNEKLMSRRSKSRKQNVNSLLNVNNKDARLRRI